MTNDVTLLMTFIVGKLSGRSGPALRGGRWRQTLAGDPTVFTWKDSFLIKGVIRWWHGRRHARGIHSASAETTTQSYTETTEKKAALFIKNRRFAVSPSGFFFFLNVFQPSPCSLSSVRTPIRGSGALSTRCDSLVGFYITGSDHACWPWGVTPN